MRLDQISSCVASNNFRLTAHAEFERTADQITLTEIKESLLSARLKIVEDYPNDPRGSSCLAVGFTKKNMPIHVVCGMGDSGTLIIITIYRPDPQEWSQWDARKEQKL